MNILAISWELCSTAAVMVDGEIMACASEERFSRKKNDDAYPKQAIEAVLRESNVSPEQLDVVALAGERFDPRYTLCHISSYSVEDRLREQRKYWYPRMYERKAVHYLDVITRVMFSWMTPLISNVFNSTLVLYWTAFVYHIFLA